MFLYFHWRQELLSQAGDFNSQTMFIAEIEFKQIFQIQIYNLNKPLNC